MSPISLYSRLRFKLERLRRFVKGDNRDYAPTFSIEFLARFIASLDNLRRFAKGHNRDYAPMFPIRL